MCRPAVEPPEVVHNSRWIQWAQDFDDFDENSCDVSVVSVNFDP